MFQDMINSFDVYKQQPLLFLNTQVQVFGYKIISYMKMLERRRSDLFVNISSANDLRMIGDVAKQLLDEAEKQAKLNGVNVIGIEYDSEESERFVFEFYKRCGYKPFYGNNNFLIKKI